MSPFPRVPLAVLLVASGAAAVGQVPVHVGRFADGNHVPAGEYANWHDLAAAQPQFAGRAVFEPGNPLRWTILRQGIGEPPAAAGGAEQYIEFCNGDRLPGVVEQYRSGTESFGLRLPAHLVVLPTVPVDVPGHPPRDRVRVAVDAVRRIVRRRPDGVPLKPGTVQLVADDRRLPVDSIRWTRGGLLLLSGEESLRVGFAEVAELALPARDPWNSYFDTTAVLAPDGTARLLRVETAQGLVATTSVERMRAFGSPNDPNSWQHLLQPAWCLEPLAAAHAAIRTRWFFAPQEVPLPLIDVVRGDRSAVFGTGWRWEVNRSVRGGPLSARGLPYGWGFGVQSQCELFFPLPAIATSFRTGVALDDAAGGGGCAIARVCLDESGNRPLWQSGTLVGSGTPADTGAIPLAPRPDGTSRLVLVADQAHEGRPAGADPYDVRDLVDWVDPAIALDAARLGPVLAERLPGTIPAWTGWQLKPQPGGTLVVRNVPVTGAAHNTGWVRQVGAQGAPLVLARRVRVEPATRYLAIGVSRSAPAGSRIEIRVDGRPASTADVPQSGAGAVVQPFLFPLTRFAGRSIELEVVQLPGDPAALVEWHVLEPVADVAPGWLRLDVEEAVSERGGRLARQADGTISVTGTPPQNDVHRLRLRTDEKGVTALRLDALRDAALAGGGPGLGSAGQFVLTGVSVEAVSVADPNRRRPVSITQSIATIEEPGWPVMQSLENDPRGGWRVDGEATTEVIAALFRFAEPVGFDGGTEFVVRLGYGLGGRQIPGRFAVSATISQQPNLAVPGIPLRVDPAATPDP